jgi:LysR family transcriptional regulator, benzoate and cis,cis-muconate-responsive activator of ben and cat genes
MELRHLRYFIAIGEEENFRRAANRLHVSQSPLSRQMQQLEDEVGAELFEPSGRGVKLTPAGRLFLEKAKAILASVDAAAKEAKETAEGRIGTLTMGFEPGASLFGTLSTLISRFRARAPRINVELLPMTSAQQWGALASRQISLGYGSHVPDDSPLQSVVLSRRRVGIMMPKGHRLASQPRVRVRDLVNEPILIDPRSANPRLYDDMITAVRAHGVNLNVTSEVPNGEVLLMLVASGLGLTFGTENAGRMLTLAGLQWKPVSRLGLEVREVVMWRPDDAEAPLLRPFLAVVRELRAELGALRTQERRWSGR